MFPPQTLAQHECILRPDRDNQAEPEQQPLNKNGNQTKSNRVGRISAASSAISGQRAIR
jgi:hypothetical protein